MTPDHEVELCISLCPDTGALSAKERANVRPQRALKAQAVAFDSMIIEQKSSTEISFLQSKLCCLKGQSFANAEDIRSRFSSAFASTCTWTAVVFQSDAHSQAP